MAINIINERSAYLGNNIRNRFFGSLVPIAIGIASFLHQGKNEEPSRLEAKSKPNGVIVFCD